MDIESPVFRYEEAFSRNLGIFTEEEQRHLRDRRVAVAGMGGVGGVHLATLARMGVGKFNIADDDAFEASNINRQYGATMDSLGRKKVAVMADAARAINPHVDIRSFDARVDDSNIDRFLDEVDLVVDGIDFFAVDARRLLFNRARAKGLHVVTAGPMGFGACLLVFDPRGMGFDDYFGIRDGMPPLEKLAAFAVGLSPRGLHLGYMDLSRVDLRSGRGPSLGAACALCASLAATEAARILLKRGSLLPAPHYFQFDPYRRIYRKGYLLLGGRNPLQTLKKIYLMKKHGSPLRRP